MTQIGTTAALLLTAVCLPGAASAAGAVEEALSERWTSAYNNGDLSALTALYAADARIQHGHCSPVAGRIAIEDFWRADIAEGGLRTELEILDSFTLDDLVYVSGNYAVKVSQGSSAAKVGGGTYTQIWRRESASEWAIHRESWTNPSCLKIKLPPEAEDAAIVEDASLSI